MKRRPVPGLPVDTYRWRDAILSENGPRNATARLVLLVIAQHMKADGSAAWPSQELIARRACVTDRVVRTHLEIAARQGWIERTRIRRDHGRNWYFTEYSATVPPAVYDRLPERPWESDPDWRRPERNSGTHPDNRKDVPPVHVTTGTPEHEYRNVVPRVPERASGDDRNDVPTNSPSELSLELSQGRCADAHRVFPKVKTENQEGSQPEPSHKALPSATSEVLRETVNQNVDAIVKLHRQGYGAGEIAKLLARRGIDTDRVRAVIDQHVRKFVL